jgi:hypothetical protein
LTGDTLFDSIPWTIWTAVECNIAITAASVPSIIPLIKKFRALRKGENTNSQERSRTATQDIEQGNQSYAGTEVSTLRKGWMQRGLLIDGDGDVRKRDMISKIRIDEEELPPLDSDDDEGISQMYANASRHISKRTTTRTLVQEDLSTATTISGPIIGEKLWA